MSIKKSVWKELVLTSSPSYVQLQFTLRLALSLLKHVKLGQVQLDYEITEWWLSESVW